MTTQILPHTKRKTQNFSNMETRREYSCSERVQNVAKTHTLLYIRIDFFVKSILFASIKPIITTAIVQYFSNFMSLFPDLKILRSRKIYSKLSHLKISMSTENTANTPASSDLEGTEEPTHEISDELIEESSGRTQNH